MGNIRIGGTACAKGIADALPVRDSRTVRRHEEKTVLRITDGEHYLIRKRPDTGLLAGMYELPTLQGKQSEAAIAQYVESLGVKPLSVTPLREAKHVFTHITWHMTGYEVKIAQQKAPPHGMILATAASLDAVYPIPSAFRAYRPTADKEE